MTASEPTVRSARALFEDGRAEEMAAVQRIAEREKKKAIVAESRAEATEFARRSNETRSRLAARKARKRTGDAA